MPEEKPGLSYVQSGVDIDAGAALVDALRPLARTTRRPGADTALGGFGGAFDLKAAGYDDPVLVSGTDGVGTKLKIAIESAQTGKLGIDLVAMCVNDILAQGAEPLFFLDYFSCGKLDTAAAATVIAGIAEGCVQARCALIGGETAEMPGLYAGKDFDLAGFAVGAAERGTLLPRTRELKAGDALIALASSGPHSNGYSLIRAVAARAGLDWDSPAPFAPRQTLAEALLEPTRIYVRALLPLIRDGRIKALAHITGGGLIDNPPRMLPPSLHASIDYASWELPPVFAWLAEAGAIAPHELHRTFNCGIGMLAAADPGEAQALVDTLNAAGEHAWVAGNLTT